MVYKQFCNDGNLHRRRKLYGQCVGYDDNIREMDAIAEKEAFAYGFRLGIRLAVAGLKDDGEG